MRVMWDVLISLWDTLIDWLGHNQNAAAVQTIATVALVLFAAWQGILAWSARSNAKRLAEAAKELADASVRMARVMLAESPHVKALASFAAELVGKLVVHDILGVLWTVHEPFPRRLSLWEYDQDGNSTCILEGNPHYSDFKQHLANQPFWSELDTICSSFYKYSQLCFEGWKTYRSAVDTQPNLTSVSLGTKARMADFLLANQVRVRELLVGLDRPNDLIVQPKEVIEAYDTLRGDPCIQASVASVIDCLLKQRVLISTGTEKVRRDLLPDRVEALILDGRCDHCKRSDSKR